PPRSTLFPYTTLFRSLNCPSYAHGSGIFFDLPSTLRVIVADIFQTLAEQFQQTTALEWLGTVTGFLCVYLAARQHILNWPISIISVAAYAILFYQSKLYGNAILQVYFFGTAIYGWYYWVKRGQDADKKPIVSFSAAELLVTA